MARKKLVLDVFRCQKCSLIFRWPLDTEAEADNYYQREYAKSAPYVQLPSPAKLSELLQANFAGSPLDRSSEIAIVKIQRPRGRVLDYGCSWGFATRQFNQQGFRATGFEISKVRAEYGREKLGVEIIDDFSELRALPGGSFDIVYSHQVLKNLVDIRSAFEVMQHLLAPGGLMFHVVPNFEAMMTKNAKRLNWIGEEHPIAPTREFFEFSLPQNGFQVIRIASSPFPENLGTVERRGSKKAPAEDDILVLATRERAD
jgi:SAM-dependent methyltransferase